MGSVLQYDRRQRVLVVKVDGVVTEASTLEGHMAVMRFLETEIPDGMIIDFSSIESTEISADFVRRIADRKPLLPAGHKRVNVAPKPDLYGMTRMFQILRDGKDPDLHVVHTLAEAYAILNIDPPDFS